MSTVPAQSVSSLLLGLQTFVTRLLPIMARSTRLQSVSSRKAHRHNPLSEDLVAIGPLREKSKKRKSKSEADDDRYVDSKSSKKILKIGQDLADEVNEGNRIQPPNSAFTFESRFADEDEPAQVGQIDDEDAWGDEDEGVIEEVVCGHPVAISLPVLTKT